MKDYSVILPLNNEEEIFEELYARVKKTMDGLEASYEIIFVDDGSNDGTYSAIHRSAMANHGIVAVKLSRNFGQDSAIVAGLRCSSGNNIVIMDGDLQDPPEFIPNLIRERENEYGVVYGVKKSRKENLAKRALTAIFYNIMFFLTNVRMPMNAGTFSVMTRDVAIHIMNCPESNKFFSGLRAFVGFKQKGVPYEKGERVKGSAKSFFSLLRMGLNAFCSFSTFPLRFAILFASGIVVVTFGVAVMGLSTLVINEESFTHLNSLIIIFILLQGCALLFLFIVVGEYVGRTHAQVKGRPEFIIESIVKEGKAMDTLESIKYVNSSLFPLGEI